MDTGTVRPKRSVRHAQEAAKRPEPPKSRKHLGRRAREQRLQRYVIGGVVAVVLLALLIPAYGYWRNVLHVGDTPMATIDGTTITADTYARYLGTRQAIIARQITQLEPLAQATPAASPTVAATASPATAGAATAAASPAATPSPQASPSPAPNSDAAKAQQQISALQSTETNLSTSGLNDLAEAKLVVDESKARNLTASQAELDDALRWLMSPPSLQNPAVPGQGLDMVPSPLPTTGLISLADAKQALTQIVGKGKFLSADQVTELILKPAVLKTKLVNQLAPNVPKTEEEVHARHILVATKAEADAIEQQLKAGADFVTLAKQKSTDTGSKDSGGDLGWFGKGVMVPEFEKAALSLSPGQISDPVQTQFGFHIIQVLEKDPNHPLDPARFESLRLDPYRQWLSKAESDPTKVKFETPAPSVMTWVQNYVQQPNS